MPSAPARMNPPSGLRAAPGLMLGWAWFAVYVARIRPVDPASTSPLTGGNGP